MRLAGLRVLDFCWIGAGAFVTRILADLGAEVIKVESQTHPDNLRLSGPHKPGAKPLESSGYFASRNTSKKSIALNMSHPRARRDRAAAGRPVLHRQQQFSPRSHGAMGAGLRRVAAVNPSVIYLAMPMQGASGPHRDYIGFGSTIAALCGLVSMAGLPGRPPIGTGTHYPDHVPNPGHALVARAGRGLPPRAHRRGPAHRARADRIDREHARPIHPGLVRDRRAAAGRRQPPSGCGAARRVSLRRRGHLVRDRGDRRPRSGRGCARRWARRNGWPRSLRYAGGPGSPPG